MTGCASNGELQRCSLVGDRLADRLVASSYLRRLYRRSFAQRDASCPGKALRRLSGDLGDEVEVLVEVYDGEPGQLCRGGDDEVGD